MTEIDFTIFADRYGKTAQAQHATLEELAEAILGTVRPLKESLPLFKSATFGDARTADRCLRHDGNVLTVTGVEGDYDDEGFSFEEAVEIAEKAGLLALIYTSPSYTPERPRWRVVAPFSEALPPERRDHMMGRLNGLFDGIFAVESWALSQSYFFGRVEGSPMPLMTIVEGTPIDRLDELDRIWRGKPNGVGGNGAAGEWGRRVDEKTLIDAIVSGENYHHASTSLLGKWAFAGISMMEAQRRLVTAFECVLPPDRDARWHNRYKDIPRTILGIYGKEADKRDRGERIEFRLHSSTNSADASELEAEPGEEPTPAAAVEDWPEPLGEAAYHGIAGETVLAIGPHTEADPAAILFQFLTAFGNDIGRRAYFLVEETKHHPNLFILLVGKTAKARKGTSWNRVRRIFWDAAWVKNCIASGLSTGEGLIHRVRNPTTEEQVDKRTGDKKTVVVDPGVHDKRLLVIEEEMARPLRAMLRPENTLSAILRCAWDGADLAIMTRKLSVYATAPHISMVAHVTQDDLLNEMDMTSTANGFGNRFLFCCIRRSKLLPLGGRSDDPVVEELARRTLDIANRSPSGRIGFDHAAEERWRDAYADLSRDRPGMYGAITARAEAQVIRLALTYALLDGVPYIGLPHLEAGLEVWRYADASARAVFGDKVGDKVADGILSALRMAGPAGMTRWDIRDMFSNSMPAARIDTALSKLEKHKLASWRRDAPTGGRPAVRWFS